MFHHSFVTTTDTSHQRNIKLAKPINRSGSFSFTRQLNHKQIIEGQSKTLSRFVVLQHFRNMSNYINPKIMKMSKLTGLTKKSVISGMI